MNSPLVSIICTCYNHSEYIQEALDSVVEQGYDHIELVVIDNGSHDASANQIRRWEYHNRGSIPVYAIFHPVSLNYCQSFNRALALVKGDYVIDLSGDDVLLPGHVARAVDTLANHPGNIYFSNALLEKEDKSTSTFYPVNRESKPIAPVRSGDMYEEVVQRTVICAPTLVVPTHILLDEGGYDESLSYEDFDLIVRLARKFHFVFNDHIGVKKRILKSSFSAQQYRIRHSVMLPSTLKVCHKIRKMNRTKQEDEALLNRLMFETKHALASANFDVALGFLGLADQIGGSGWRYRLFRLWAKTKFDLSFLYKHYAGLK